MLVALLLSLPSPLTQAILHKQSCGRSILLLHFNAGMRIKKKIIIIIITTYDGGICWWDDRSRLTIHQLHG